MCDILLLSGARCNRPELARCKRPLFHGEIEMVTRIIDLEAAVVCSACWHRERVIVIEADSDGREYITCGVCRRPYYRTGHTCWFESPDGRRMLIPDATPTADVVR